MRITGISQLRVFPVRTRTSLRPGWAGFERQTRRGDHSPRRVPGDDRCVDSARELRRQWPEFFGETCKMGAAGDNGPIAFSPGRTDSAELPRREAEAEQGQDDPDRQPLTGPRRHPARGLRIPLGNRSALEGVIDQYQVSTDKRSGITSDPNREDAAPRVDHRWAGA